MQTYNHWQLPPSGQTACTGLDDINLCIRHILNTCKGEDILRPTFGSNHLDYLDQPQDVAIPNMVREIFLALAEWEPRIDVEEVQIQGIAPHFTFAIFWRLKENLQLDLQTTFV